MENYNTATENKNFQDGDYVVMHSCGEADFEQYKGKIWTCRGSSFISRSKAEVVFLNGFSGSFICRYLQSVNIGSIKSL